MIKFILAAMVGYIIGIGTMCFMVMAGEEDRQLEKLNDRCKFCGGKLSEVRIDADGKEYRYCYSCFHEYEVTDDA